MKWNYTFITLLFLTINLCAQPTRLWGTYFGDAGDERINSTAIDANANVLVCGYSTSTINIATLGSQQPNNAGLEDAFIAKFDSSGVLLWATYFGGPDDERANAICVDGSGNIYVSGHTASSVSISTAGCHQPVYGGNSDAFLAKYNSAGVLQWATYYGGQNADGAQALSLDVNGNIYLTGGSGSTNGISTAGTHQLANGGGLADAFVVKFNSSGIRQWGTYYGGAMDDYGACVALDAGGNVYLTGYSNSTNAISTAGSHQVNLDGGIQHDAYLAKFSSSGMLLWATYYGGLGYDRGWAVAVSQSGDVYLAGQTHSGNNISTVGSHQFTFGGGSDAFLVNFNSSGVRQWGTYYGGSFQELFYYIGVDVNGNILASGDALSSNSISTVGSHQPNFGGVIDGFAVKFNSFGVRQWGTYYGGSGIDRGISMGMDPNGNFYLGGVTESSSGISTANCHQFTPGAATDCYLVRFADCNGPPDTGLIGGPTVVCEGAGASVYSVAPGAISYTWVLPGGWSGVSSNNTISATPGVSGTFSVTASNVCGTSAQQTLNITVSGLPTITVNSGSICAGNAFTMVAGGASTYTFEGGNAVVSPNANVSYTVMGTNSLGCVSQSFATSTVMVYAFPLPTVTVNSGSICSGQSFTMIPNGANTYTFSGGSAIVSPTSSSSYSVSGTNTAGCLSSEFAVSIITVAPLPNIDAASTSSMLCFGETATLTASGASTYTWSPGGGGQSIVISPTITSSFTVAGTNSISGCENFTVLTQNVSPCVGVNEQGTLITLLQRCYPNPAGTAVFFDLPLQHEVDLIIMDALGKELKKIPQYNNQSKVDVSELPEGIYFYKAIGKTAVYSGKFVKG